MGNSQLGALLSRVQATVIRRGNELEGLVERATPEAVKTTVEQVRLMSASAVSHVGQRYEVVFGHKLPPVVQADAKAYGRGSALDLVIFDHHERRFTVIELKDGDTFDTKKASGELASLEAAGARLQELTGYASRIAFCSFNQSSREAIAHGAKQRFSLDQVMTGRELCSLLSVDYDTLRRERESDQPENLRYFIDQLVEIDEVRALVRAALDAYDRLWGRRSP
jgi:hypothetical protein